MTSKTIAAKDDRIDKIRVGKFIDYTRAREIVDALEDLLATPKVHRMPNLLLVGETNNGKTMIINRFVSRHKSRVDYYGSGSTVPVLFMQCPSVPDESRFYNNLLSKLYAPFRPSARTDLKQLEAVRALDRMGVRMLIIDEFHKILKGTPPKQEQFRSMIHYLGNELMIPIVGVGTQDAFFAIQDDRQLENRFEPMLVPKWKMGEDYLRLLASFEATLMLRNASNLAAPALALRILAKSEGTIGEMSRLLKAAAIHAIRTKTESIDCAALDDCGYVSPPDRRKRLE